MNYTVYKHTSPSNKVYIGITKQNPVKRWDNGSGYSNNEYFQRAIKKYGWNNFKHEILFTGFTKDEATQKEIELIAFYKSNDRNFGYNISSGGEAHNGCKQSEELKQKLSQLYKGKLFAKTVYQYSLNGELIKVWNCAREAERQLKIKHVSECCRGERKTIGGFVWSYSPLSEVKVSYQRNRTYY